MKWKWLKVKAKGKTKNKAKMKVWISEQILQRSALCRIFVVHVGDRREASERKEYTWNVSDLKWNGSWRWNKTKPKVRFSEVVNTFEEAVYVFYPRNVFRLFSVANSRDDKTRTIRWKQAKTTKNKWKKYSNLSLKKYHFFIVKISI